MKPSSDRKAATSGRTRVALVVSSNPTWWPDDAARALASATISRRSSKRRRGSPEPKWNDTRPPAGAWARAKPMVAEAVSRDMAPIRDLMSFSKQ